jgi:hypothetical protein
MSAAGSRLFGVVVTLVAGGLVACTASEQTVTGTTGSQGVADIDYADPCSLLDDGDVESALGVAPTSHRQADASYFADDSPGCIWQADAADLVTVYLGAAQQTSFGELKSALDYQLGDPGVGDESFFSGSEAGNQVIARSGDFLASVIVATPDPDVEKAKKQTVALAEAVVGRID